MTSRSGKKSQRAFLYRSLASYLEEVCGKPLRKVPVDPGFGCPNRDGTFSSEGCAFCNLESFVPLRARSGQDPVSQVERWRKGRENEPYIVYLQSGTATHTDPRVFRDLVNTLCGLPGAVGLFVATRPDCVAQWVFEALEPWIYRRLIWLELGLQSAMDPTLELLGRGHKTAAFTTARALAREAGVPVLAHVILGLPGEGVEDMLRTARYLAELEVEGVKIHHLQVIRKTPMERMLTEGRIVPLSWESYPSLVTAFLEELPSSTVIHRLLSDAPGELLIAPVWPARAKVLQAIRDHMVTGGHWQGRMCKKG